MKNLSHGQKLAGDHSLALEQMAGPPNRDGKHLLAVAVGLLFLMLLMFWFEVLHRNTERSSHGQATAEWRCLIPWTLLVRHAKENAAAVEKRG